ncbi:hypothetical protein [Natrarchaeobius chitinivorans]|uniref:Uncharacterized protein n=1 Tax=Natrarchaeobius chitinivorans TaxID=1679083 RepID=A0A3N6LU00_NATCH|nr:hypothetical protein [Natrarchaeobius chitinivorans]RQG92077.1 hypothetical protein EA473_17620 [Natrarchaeobius chitinivorans]
MAVVTAPAIAAFGVLATIAIFVFVRRDAVRRDVTRPNSWAAVAAVPFLVGVSLHLFATVPTTGVIMTANTGLVLYTFEREIAAEDDDPAEPGRLPHDPVRSSSDSTRGPESDEE